MGPVCFEFSIFICVVFIAYVCMCVMCGCANVCQWLPVSTLRGCVTGARSFNGFSGPLLGLIVSLVCEAVVNDSMYCL